MMAWNTADREHKPEYRTMLSGNWLPKAIQPNHKPSKEVSLSIQKSAIFFSLIGIITLLIPGLASAEKINIPDVGSIVVPEIMEVKDLLENKAVRDKVYKKMNIDPKSMGGVQRNLVVKQKGMKLYSRIIVETIPGQPGDYDRINSKYTMTSEEMKITEEQLKASFESQFKNTSLKILQWYPFKLVDINGIRALHFSFRRQLNNNPQVLVKYYLFQNYDRLIRLTASYRLDEKEIWQDFIQKSINSFRITPYISEKETEPTSNDIMSMLYGDNWGLFLIISFIITWAIGLIPPLLLRFAIIRKPISKKLSIFLVILLWFINVIIFMVLGSQSKTHGALVLVAIASYYILRKGSKAPNLALERDRA